MTPSVQVPLGELAEFVMGQAPPSAACNTAGEGVPFVKAGEFSARRPVVREWTTKPLKLARAGDVLVCVVGATAGKLNQGIDCAIGRSVAAIRPRSERLCSEYLYWFLSTRVGNLRRGSQGIAQGVITRDMLAEVRVPLPPIDEQRRIAAILDQADALLTKRRRHITILDLLPRALYDSAFGDPINGSAGQAARIGEVAAVQIGPFGSLLHQEDYIEGGVPIVNPMHIRDGQIVGDPAYSVRPEKSKDLATYRLCEGDVVLGRRGEMGRCAVVGGEQAGWLCGTGSVIVRPSESVTPQFLRATLSHPSTKAALERRSLGSTLPNLNSSIVSQLVVRIPSRDEQRMFDDQLRCLATSRRHAERQQAALNALFVSLQSRAFADAL